MREYRYHAPGTMEELFDVIRQAQDEAVAFVAGGTDIVPKLNLERQEIPRETKAPLHLVSLAGLGLNTVEEDGGDLVVGALCTLSDLADSGQVREKVPALAQAIDQMAGLSVRNVATLGGNIMNASPAADSVPALMAMDARFVLRYISGTREVPADQFFTGPGKTVAHPGEVLTHIKIPLRKGTGAFRKLGRRKAETLSVVNAAAYVEMENGVCSMARIAVGSAAPTVVRCRSAEDALVGGPLDEARIKAACDMVAQEISPIDDIRSTAWYRVKTAPVMASRAVMAAAGLQ